MALTSRLVLLCVLAVASAQRQAPLPRNGGLNNRGGDADADADADVINGDEIPGVAGIDYPVLSEAPRTSFTCDLLDVPGYYADQQAGCQVYYRCQNGGRGVATLCPNGTVFNQETLVCDWWYNVDCSRALDFYKVNEDVVLEMAAVDANNALARRPTLSPLASRIPSLTSRLRNPAAVSPFDRRAGVLSPFAPRTSPFAARTNPFVARTNPFASPARYSQNSAQNSARGTAEGSSATDRNTNSGTSKNSGNKSNDYKNNDYKNDKKFDGYNYPNPNGIDRSYLPPSK